MDQLHLLLLLSFSMLIGSFLSGSIPMSFKLSDSKSRLLALMGSGILVGTALAIIIPEGIDAIYAKPTDPPSLGSDEKEAPQEPVDNWLIGLPLVAGFVLMLMIEQFSIYQGGSESLNIHTNTSHNDYTLANQEDENDTIDETDHSEDDPSKLINDIGITSDTRHARENETLRISVRPNDSNQHGNNYLYTNNRQLPHRRSGDRSSKTKVTPTLGLVIHAAADGIALGAAATSSHRHVEMIIFLAIMLHKAPAAFSLVVLLLHKGLKPSTIRRHLLAFSLSAPMAALLTFFGLSQSGKEALRRNNATGIAMLFSAGTFLYVATVHVLPELVHNRLLSPKELLFLVGGTFLPILLAQTI